jgi:hypothetical protein
MRISAAVLTLLTPTLFSSTAFSQQSPPTGEELCPIVDPGTQVRGDSITGDPVASDPIAEGPEGEQPDAERPRDEQPEGEEPMPGESPGADGPAETAVENWLLDFPQAATPWQSDGTTFSSETCTWSGIVPILTGVSLIAGPIERSDGILPLFGMGIISDGEMSAVAIRFLLFFPILTAFEGEQVADGLPGEELHPPQEPTEEGETPEDSESEEGTHEMPVEDGPDIPTDRTFGLRR